MIRNQVLNLWTNDQARKAFRGNQTKQQQFSQLLSVYVVIRQNVTYHLITSYGTSIILLSWMPINIFNLNPPSMFQAPSIWCADDAVPIRKPSGNRRLDDISLWEVRGSSFYWAPDKWESPPLAHRSVLIFSFPPVNRTNDSQGLVTPNLICFSDLLKKIKLRILSPKLPTY